MTRDILVPLECHVLFELPFIVLTPGQLERLTLVVYSHPLVDRLKPNGACHCLGRVEGVTVSIEKHP